MSEKPRTLIPIEAELAAHGICVINTNGRSMRPLLKAGCAVNIKALDRELKKYDVVLYKNNTGRYILHRIIGFDGDICIIRGDNTYAEEHVRKSDIIGYMISYIKKSKVKEVSRLSYRIYSRFWNFIYPLRRIARKIKSLLKKKKR